jgi:hypothetical protein
MTIPDWIPETTIHGGRVVRPGDTVEVLPVVDEKHGHYFDRWRAGPLERWLGRGPYTIEHIGLWPRGRIMLYLKTPDGHAGTCASDFM